jgi:hypothetical protein
LDSPVTQTTRPAKGPPPAGRRAAAAAARETEAETEEEDAADAEEGCIPGSSSLEHPLLAITSTPLRAIAAAAGAWPGGFVRSGESERAGAGLGEREREDWIRWWWFGGRGEQELMVMAPPRLPALVRERGPDFSARRRRSAIWRRRRRRRGDRWGGLRSEFRLALASPALFSIRVQWPRRDEWNIQRGRAECLCGD